MTNKEKINKIIEKLESAEWETVSVDYSARTLVFKKGFNNVKIYFEECVCHGGRITISEENHNGSWYRIEHEEYDESVGIVDSETELLWEIENELLEVINKFDNYVFKSCVINEYGAENGRDNERIDYHKSLEDAFGVIHGQRENINPLTFNERVFNYPNEECHLKITKIYKESNYSWDKNKVWFKCEYTNNNWKTVKEYEAYITYFDKKVCVK